MSSKTTLSEAFEYHPDRFRRTKNIIEAILREAPRQTGAVISTTGPNIQRAISSYYLLLGYHTLYCVERDEILFNEMKKHPHSGMRTELVFGDFFDTLKEVSEHRNILLADLDCFGEGSGNNCELMVKCLETMEYENLPKFIAISGYIKVNYCCGSHQKPHTYFLEQLQHHFVRVPISNQQTSKYLTQDNYQINYSTGGHSRWYSNLFMKV